MIKYPKIAAWLLLPLCTAPMLQALSEENIKAAYLERFAMFIEWPHQIEKYNICVYEDKNFANVLETNYKSRLFNNRPINVIPLNTGASEEKLSACHILYYRGSKPHQNANTLYRLQKNHVLVISDDADDTQRGSILSFYIENNGYRFIINQRNLQNTQLSASYKLLKFATIVDSVGK